MLRSLLLKLPDDDDDDGVDDGGDDDEDDDDYDDDELYSSSREVARAVAVSRIPTASPDQKTHHITKIIKKNHIVRN